jgi:hypothetical protein
MTGQLEEIVIPKEDAVFWLDKKGRWHNKHGEFEHPKIINYFHSSIKRDEDGYYLGQIKDNYLEKVYFPYEDTALFVFDIVKKEDVILVLNTKKQIKLKPEQLSIKGDDLYMIDGEERIKFAERGLLKISDFMEYEGDKYFIRIKNMRYEIPKV